MVPCDQMAMTIYELLQRLHTTLDEMDAALGVGPHTKAEVALERTRRIFAAAVPVTGASKPKRQGKTPEQRAAHGERMRQYWANRWAAEKRKRERPKGSKSKPKEEAQ